MHKIIIIKNHQKYSFSTEIITLPNGYQFDEVIVLNSDQVPILNLSL